MAVGLWFVQQSVQEYDDRIKLDVFVNNLVTRNLKQTNKQTSQGHADEG